MITRTYFVTYAKSISNNQNLIGSVVLTSKSIFPQTKSVFTKAVDFVQKEHGAAINGFARVV